jgi:predicted ATP-dependent endonuclease of OLD family
MHRLAYVVIKNFRACRDLSLPLADFTPLVGQNNVGKSTILDAIQWALKPTALAVSDFYNPKQPVEVCVRIDGVTQEILDHVPDQKHHRPQIEPYCVNGCLWIRVTAEAPGKKKCKEEVWDPAQAGDQVTPTAWRDYPTGITQGLQPLFPEPLYIAAMDHVDEDLGKSKANSTIKHLLDEVMQPVLAAHQELHDALQKIGDILLIDGGSRSEELKAFDTAATRALGDFFPGLAVQLGLQTVDIKEFFKAGDLHIVDQATGERQRFDQFGSGAQRVIQMSLVRYLAETRAAVGTNPSRRVLLIDEPELFLHPQAARHLRGALGVLTHAGFQVIFSTHSPAMLDAGNAPNAILVRKCKAGTVVRKPMSGAVVEAINDGPAQADILFQLGNVADIYFSNLVVLCEGKTDRRLLPLAYRQLYGHDMDLDGIAFVSVGGCGNFAKAMAVLRAMEIHVCAVADLDFAFVQARKAGLLDKVGEDLVAAKSLFARLASSNTNIALHDGLPTSKGRGQRAEASWSDFAADREGQALSDACHIALERVGIWVWRGGCIETVLGAAEKGEDAISTEEARLRGMTDVDVAREMPQLKACLDWIRARNTLEADRPAVA